MMNDETEQFENRLRQQLLKKTPVNWRAEILSAVHQTQTARHSSPVTRHWLSTLNQKLSTIFWPHPKAWVGLATVWVFILVLNFSTRDKTPMIAEKSAPPSPEVLVELKKQQLLFAELIGTRETTDADRPKIFAPRPRSKVSEVLMT